MKTRFLILFCVLIATPCVRAESTRPASFAPAPLSWLEPLGGKDKVKQKVTLDKLPTIEMAPAPVTWLDDDHFLQSKDGKLVKVHALSGKTAPLYNSAKLAECLAAMAGLTKEAVASLAESPFLMNPQHTAGLFKVEDALYYCNLDATAGGKMPKIAGAELQTFSPDGKLVAFVRNWNLWVLDVDAKKERQLTTDGNGTLSNGKADWVYYEEIFHRKYKAFWWSPDSKYLAFLHFDDANVTKYTLIDPTARVQKPEIDTYPKAGATNPTVKLGLVAVAEGKPSWVDLNDYKEGSLLVIRAGWRPDSQKAYFYVQDRIQTWLDICEVPRTGGKPVKLLRDSTKAWIDDPGTLHFLKDGTFLLLSERSGYKHIYHYAADGKLKGAVTSGEWDVRTLQKVDEKDGWVYFSGTRDSWLASNTYRAKLEGGGVERLTKAAGTHNVTFGPNAKYFVDTFSAWDTPPQTCLCQGDGKVVRIIEKAAVNNLSELYQLGRHEFVQIRMPDGLLLDATVLLPPNYDANKKYPVWFKTYAGPGTPTLRNAWAGGGMADQATATMGFIVFRFDPRSATGRGAISAWTAYKQLGVQELKDIESAIKWLIDTYPGVDAKRIGMSGHSYGGYITAYAMTHSKLFAAGIAGAPVTDWRNYDTIYTERYMDTPQNNPKGYEVSSVTLAAKNLSGRLLIIHGMMDDNVHVQNTVEFMDALQKADRDFEIMFYPHARHGIGGKHYQRLQVDFMKRVLQP